MIFDFLFSEKKQYKRSMQNISEIIRNDELEKFNKLKTIHIDELYSTYIDDFHRSNNSLCLLELIKRGLKLVRSNGDTILHDAVIYGNYYIFDTLLKLGIDINAKDSNGQTVLHCFDSAYNSIITKNIIVEKLFLYGVDPNIRDNDGNTALHVLIPYNYGMQEYKEIIKLFLENGANTEIRNNEGELPYDLMEDFDDDEKEWYLNMVSKYSINH